MSWVKNLKNESSFDLESSYSFNKHLPSDEQGLSDLMGQIRKKIDACEKNGDTSVKLSLEEGILASLQLKKEVTVSVKFAFPSGSNAPLYVSFVCVLNSPDGNIKFLFPLDPECEKISNMAMIDSPEVKVLNYDDFYESRSDFHEDQLGDRFIGSSKERAFLILDTLQALDCYKISYHFIGFGLSSFDSEKWIFEAAKVDMTS